MPASQVLNIHIINCGGLTDIMSEMESSFLLSALGLFRYAKDWGRGTPRANVTFARAYNAEDFYRSAFADADILHLIAHANGTELQVGSKKKVTATNIGRRAKRANKTLPPVIVSTGCKVQSAAWQSGMRSAGARVLIASTDEPSPACLTAFDMSFYSALLSRVWKTKSLDYRIERSFALADTHYRAVHAVGSPFAKFTRVVL